MRTEMAGADDGARGGDRRAGVVRASPPQEPAPSATPPRGGGAGRDTWPIVAVDEYAGAVVDNGLRRYRAARAAARRASAVPGFRLVDWALAELVEASVHTDGRDEAIAALRRMEASAGRTPADWSLGLIELSRGLLDEDESAEGHFLQAMGHLGGAGARVAVARTELVYGEWLRRRGRRMDARRHLERAAEILSVHGMVAFTERVRGELLATGASVRRRSEDTRLDLTSQEAQIAHLASTGRTNSEIGERLSISTRTVEWHLRKVFTKLAIQSRRELQAVLPSHEGRRASA